MATGNAQNVTASKPRTTGCVYRAATTASAPTDATSSLGGAFTSLGYLSEDGIANSNSPETAQVKAFGGDVVLNTLTGKEDTFKFKLIESTNTDVLSAVYGSGNVSGTLQSGIKVTAKSGDLEESMWVIDLILKGGILKRTVIPCASISEMSEVVYNDTDAVGYEITLQATPDLYGATHYDYIKQTTPTPAS